MITLICEIDQFQLVFYNDEKGWTVPYLHNNDDINQIMNVIKGK